jgi:hypothetical protein
VIHDVLLDHFPDRLESTSHLQVLFNTTLWDMLICHANHSRLWGKAEVGEGMKGFWGEPCPHSEWLYLWRARFPWSRGCRIHICWLHNFYFNCIMRQKSAKLPYSHNRRPRYSISNIYRRF